MPGLINELIDVLNSQSEVYEKLLELSMSKKNVIIKNEINVLKEITASENALIGKSQRLEKKRLGLISDVANVLNEKEENITLTSLAEIIKEQAEHEILVEATKRIRTVLEELKTVNDGNKILIENSLEYIDFNINVMQSTFSEEPPTYSSKGEEIVKSRSILDVKN